MEDNSKAPRLVASTGNTYSCSIVDSRIRESERREYNGVTTGEGLDPGLNSKEETLAKRGRGIRTEDDVEVNYFKSAQWTPDGTTLLTSSADNAIRTFILPPDLLTDTSPPPLTSYTTHPFPTPINRLTPYPYFALSDPSTTLYLSTPSSLPIRLLNALSPLTTPVATYNLISPTTEAYYTPSSLLWSTQNSFLAGTDCLIACFDVSRSGEGPATRMPTIPSKRHKMKGGGVGMRGIVSALSQQPSPENADAGMLAAGTWTRWVGLYDVGGMGGTVATWGIQEAADGEAGIGGTGVSETGWSACGRYLFVVERKSRGLLVYDVRVTGRLVSWLVGREAETNQRLGVGLFEGEKGTEVWAGGTDGVVRVWEGVGMTEGAMERSWEWKAHDGMSEMNYEWASANVAADPVSSTAVHSSGTVVATCSGQRSSPELWSSNGSESEESDSSDGERPEDDSERDSDSEQETDSEGSSGSGSSSRLSSTSSLSPEPVSRSPDNSIKVWSL